MTNREKAEGITRTWSGSPYLSEMIAQALSRAEADALERAARACEAISERRENGVRYEDAPLDFRFMAEGADECAEAIRAIKPGGSNA